MEKVVPDFIKVQGIEIGFHELKIENYSQKKGMEIKEYIESEPFTVGDIQWQIRFFPSGYDVNANKVGDTSVFLHHVGELSDIGAVRILQEVFVVDQTSKGIHWGYSLFTKLPCYGVPSVRPGRSSGAIHFVSNEKIQSYLKDDCLILRVFIGVLTSKMQPYLAYSDSYIGADLGKLLETKYGADVTFEIGSETFHAHQCILAARSSVFESSFSGVDQKQHQTITLDTNAKLFKAMLRFIYTDDLQEESLDDQVEVAPGVKLEYAYISESFLAKMVMTAQKFGVPSLKKVCESRILEMICVRGVSLLLKSAIDRGDHELKEACLKFRNNQKIGGSLQVNCQQLLSVLCSVNSRPQIRTWKDTLSALFKDYVTTVYNPIDPMDEKKKSN